MAQRNPQASDDGDGSRDRPWKTVAKAAAKTGPGDTVIIRDGVYREASDRLQTCDTAECNSALRSRHESAGQCGGFLGVIMINLEPPHVGHHCVHEFFGVFVLFFASALQVAEGVNS